MKFTIPIAPKTKKNHQRIARRKDGSPFVLPSKEAMHYAKAAAEYLYPRPEEPINYPVEVRCLFYMPTRRRVDLTNLLEGIDDVLVTASILDDDNSSIIASHDGSRVLYDKENPRTEVEIIPMV